MFVFILSLLLTANIGYGLECIINCSIDEVSFDEPFRIPDGQCQQRLSTNRCTVSLYFNYNERTYSVEFANKPSIRDDMFILSGPYLIYAINYACSNNTNCVISYAQDRIAEMTSRRYDTKHIYSQMAPYLKNSSPDGPLKCYNTSTQIIKCSPGDLCVLEYDTIDNEIRSRGCESADFARVFYYDNDFYTSLRINCARHFCNTIARYRKIQLIFIENGLIDVDGRRSSAAIREIASSISVAFVLLFCRSFSHSEIE